MNRPPFYPQLTRALRAWFRKNARNLPWRQTTDPYHILLSEVMLQQTQVSRVVLKYNEFLTHFPTIHHLAQASKGDIIKLWSGMGYNNRALRLHQLANIVAKQYNGTIPSSIPELIALPGIGRYTSHAVASFAFKQRVPLVDTNVERVFGRCFPEERQHYTSWEIAEVLLPQSHTDTWNQALMELGSLICTSSSPLCHQCPWNTWCPKHIVPLHKKKRKHREPSLMGVPNRLYRGKIVQHLRQQPFSDIEELFRVLHISTKHRRWLVTLLSKMEQDGIIELHGTENYFRISLPK